MVDGRLNHASRKHEPPDCRGRPYGVAVFARDINGLTVAGAKVGFGKIPGFLDGIAEALAVIIDVARKMQGICRRAKKNMKRLGSLYWSKLDTWDALRRAI